MSSEATSTSSAGPAEVALRVREVGKVYRVYSKPIDRLWELLRPGVRRSRDSRALSNVSFDVARGEAVAVIGRNGSGKTTLLRIICGVTRPTSGHVDVRGRVAPLLALGAGFNPEFTGRENIRINATVLGLTAEEIDERYERIAGFADIGDAIDQPVRTYSSGMYARLGFAVAASVDPDILVVDEVLSVGDELFARKCFARLEDLRRRGTTILFVSHSVKAVLETCDRAILLDRGEVIAEGSARDVVRRYHALLYTGTPEVREADVGAALAPEPAPSSPPVRGDEGPAEGGDVDGAAESESPAPGAADDGSFDAKLVADDSSELPPNGATIRNLRLVNLKGEPRNRLRHRARYRLEYEVEFDRDAVAVIMGFHFRTTTGVRIAGAFVPAPPECLDVQAGETLRVSFPFQMSLLWGTYFVQVSVRSLGESGFLHRLADVIAVTVDPAPTAARGLVSLLTHEPRIERVARPVRAAATDGAPD